MSIAADYEFFSRPEWAALQKAYGLKFRTQRQMQPDFMYAAAASGEVDVIAGYTSDGLIAKYDLVVLEDIRHAIPPYDAIVLLAPKRANDEALRAALEPLLGRIDIADMREANLRAAGGDGASSPDAVARWLWENEVGKQSGGSGSQLRREGRRFARPVDSFRANINAWAYGFLLSQERRRQARRGERLPQSCFQQS